MSNQPPGVILIIYRAVSSKPVLLLTVKLRASEDFLCKIQAKSALCANNLSVYCTLPNHTRSTRCPNINCNCLSQIRSEITFSLQACARPLFFFFVVFCPTVVNYFDITFDQLFPLQPNLFSLISQLYIMLITFWQIFFKQENRLCVEKDKGPFTPKGARRCWEQIDEGV